MRIKNLEPERDRERRKHPRSLRRMYLWAFLSFAAFVLIFPAGLVGQQKASYGTSGQSPLQFAGESTPENLATLSFGATGLYDDNVLGNNAERVSDEALSLNSHLDIVRQSARVGLTFGYTPFFLLYRQFSKFDRLNQMANLNLSFQLSPRFVLGMHDSVGYLYGGYPSLSGAPILSGPISPTTLNQIILPYTIRTLTNMSGLDLTFDKSQRTSIALSGSYNLTRFGNQGGIGEALYNGTGISGGVAYSYKVTEHTTLGVRVLHQDDTYGISGFRERTQIESGLFFFTSQLSPTLTITGNGGPQYAHSLGVSSAQAGVAEGFYGAGGGSITKEVRSTAVSFSAQRKVSDSGGLYTSVISTSANLGVRRRLVGHWEADLHVGATQADTAFFHASNERIDAIIGGIDFRRPLRKGAEFHISYDSMHELSKGPFIAFPGFDRNQVSIGFDYRLAAIALGR